MKNDPHKSVSAILRTSKGARVTRIGEGREQEVIGSRSPNVESLMNHWRVSK